MGVVCSGHVVRGAGRGHGVDRTHGYDVGVVPRRGDRAVAVVAESVEPPVISRGHNDHDARLPSLFGSLAERIERSALVNTAAEREAYHPNVVLALELDRSLYR